MGKLTEPFAGGTMKKKSLSKTVEIETYKFNNLRSPYAGEITIDDPSDCNGKLQIKHQVDGQIIYTEFCGVSSTLPTGGRVSNGEKIGKAKDDTVEMTIRDSSLRPINHVPFFSDIPTTDSTQTTSDNNKKPKSYSKGDTDKLVLWNFFGDMLSKPVDLLHKVNPLSKQAWTGKKTTNESVKDNDVIFENQVDRIKKLMK